MLIDPMVPPSPARFRRADNQVAIFRSTSLSAGPNRAVQVGPLDYKHATPIGVKNARIRSSEPAVPVEPVVYKVATPIGVMRHFSFLQKPTTQK